MSNAFTEPTDYAEFRIFAAALGRDPLCVQAAGGNVSLKHNGAMWVKASGACLKDAAVKNIFAVIDHDHGSSQFGQDVEPEYRRLDNDAALRPSIETSLHAALPHRIVVHVHAVPVLPLAVRLDARTLCGEKLSGLNYAFVSYAKPGWPLTLALQDLLKPPAPNIFILGNHGLIVGGETVAEVKTLLDDITARLETKMRPAPPPDMKFLEQFKSNKWRLPQSSAVHSLATDITSLGYATGGSLYPDHVVFLNRGCRATEGEYLLGVDPAKNPLILVNNKGVLLAANLSPSGEAMVECLAAVLSRIPEGARLNYLTSRDETELLNWDAEKYRQAAI